MASAAPRECQEPCPKYPLLVASQGECEALREKLAEMTALYTTMDGWRMQAQALGRKAAEEISKLSAELEQVRAVSEGRRKTLLEKSDELTKAWQRAERAEAELARITLMTKKRDNT